MRKKIHLVLLSFLLSITCALSQVVQTVNVASPGGLSTAIGNNLKTVTDLTLTGTINTTDFQTIKQMTALKNLDMSKVNIVDNTIPAASFQGRILNSIQLPEGLEILGSSAFQNTKIASIIILPQSLKIIQVWAFASSNAPVDFSKTKQSLVSLHPRAFDNYTGLSTLDFSEYPSTLKLESVQNHGAFSGYRGHVIYPKSMDNIPGYTFFEFKGSVDLPQGIKTMGGYAFGACNMKSLLLPEGLEYIASCGFRGSKIASPLVLPSTIKTIYTWAFADSNTPVDFSKTKQSLVSLHPRAFDNYTGLSTLDFSDYPSTLKLESVQNHGAFSGYAGHVIYPKSMDNIPGYTFFEFKGSLDLPQGIKTMGGYAFGACNMKSLLLPEGLQYIASCGFRGSKIASPLVLPSSIKTVYTWAFADSNTPVDFSKTKQSLVSLHPRAFDNYTGLSTLDFSEYPSTLKFENVINHGAFSGYAGHVIYPKSMDNIPWYTFFDFKGSVDLPQGIKTILYKAFEYSTITSIEIPSSVLSISSDVFSNCSKLEKIISHNPTPPTLGTNVFAGVNKQTTVLEVPKASINLYGTAAQWKDFLKISTVVPTLPNKVALVYKINPKLWTLVDGQSDNIEVNYEGVRIGEYYWMNSNFNHREPDIIAYGRTRLSGFENAVPMSSKIINTALSRSFIDSTQYAINPEEFIKYYGSYYGSETREYYMESKNGFGRIFENGSTTANQGWNLPSVLDFRQLIAMSPFMKSNTSKELNLMDMAYGLVAPMNSNPMLNKPIYDKFNNNRLYYHYFSSEAGGNPYGFNLMMGGDRQNIVGPGGQHYKFKYDNEGKIISEYYAQTGDIIQIFDRGRLAARDGSFSLHETVDTRQIGYHTEAKDYHWLPVRWCRPLTEEELGYKLYIKIDNIDTQSKAWKDLSENNYDITLLNYMRNNSVPTNQTSIIKLGLTEKAPVGYVELPKGYIRGFYVQYILNKPQTTVTVSDIMQYAYNVQDYVLDMGGENHTRLPGSSIPGYSAPKALEVKEPVVPFKSDASVSLYPNPVEDVLNISGKGVDKVNVYDMSGRQVLTANKVNTLSVSTLKAGTYIVKVFTSKGESTHKIIKK